MPVEYQNLTEELVVSIDTFLSKRISLAGNNYRLANYHHLSVSETDGVYCVADPRVGRRIKIRATCRWMGLPIVDMPKYLMEWLTLSVHTIIGVSEILPLTSESQSLIFRELAGRR